MNPPSIFNSLPLLHDAASRMNDFLGIDGDIVHEALCTDLSMVVSRYPTESRRRGLALVHRHFDLCDDEVLLHEGNVSKPVSLRSRPLETLVPVAWAFCNGYPVPYEYTDANGVQPLDVEFARDVVVVLSKYGLDDRLGLTSIDEDPGKVEYTTESRENITVPVGLRPRDSDLIAASWTFASLSKAGPPMRTYVYCVQTTIYRDGVAISRTHLTIS